MRAFGATVLLMLLLAGCATAPEPARDPLLGFCPQWALHGSDTHKLSTEAAPLAGNGTGVRLWPGDNATMWRNRPLDMYRIRLDELSVANGTLELRAFADGRLLNWRDYRGAAPQSVPVLVVETAATAVGRVYEVYLTPVVESDTPTPRPLVIRATADDASEIALTVEYGYRVCGL